ncbi:tyrosine-protein phosphatase [Saccharopolyspora sp. K220]|uniref:tyrosine-protein phosphatase n=1 Tax=Saccharopolyspora soli TaxID=2926618 RepID=UPI001F585B3B|nr:tyrosine-protein phosphatase [Saccharopolyspora soli]MCI2422047.1 tyrosine-protein phosphatase [Saccharopolyspora soli]
MTVERVLAWDGCLNTRDRGGLRLSADRKTRWGAMIRSDDPAALAEAGWSALPRGGRQPGGHRR